MYRVLVNLCLIALHMSSNSAGASPVDGESLFDSSTLLKFNMPTKCEGKNFCFDRDDDYTQYPESVVESLLDQWPSQMFSERHGTDSSYRIGCDTECETENNFSNKPIYYIRDEFDEVRAVVQSPGRFDQIYGTRWCKRPGRISYNTKHFMEGSPTLTNKNVTCVDMHMHVDFFVLSSEGKLQTAKAKGGIPVCCKCMYHELHRYGK